MSETIYDIEQLQSKYESEFSALSAFVTSAPDTMELHSFEKDLFEKLQRLGLAFMQYFLAQRGTGYQPQCPPVDAGGKRLEYKGTLRALYLSIFGEVTIERARYKKADGSYDYPLDRQLNLPEQKYSYLLQKWLQAGAVETNYRQAIELLNEILGLAMTANVPKRIGEKTAASVDDFYENEPTAKDEDGSHLAVSADGKGIRILKSERQGETKISPSRPRLGRGEKPGIKKEAVVTANFSFNPEPRHALDIVNSLLNEPSEEENTEMANSRSALNKHVRATLGGKDEAMDRMMRRLIKQDPKQRKPIVALLDGAPSLEKALTRAMTKCNASHRLNAVILDVIHVAEYVWEVATALHGEKGIARVNWVRTKLVDILDGKVRRVIGGLKQIMTKNKLTQAQKKAIRKTITYFENHAHMMDYKRYLQKGYPIATGVVEGACGSLVKNRMEQSGMRWTIKGAQDILKLRAVKLNGDWEAFWKNHMDQQKNNLYPNEFRRAA